MVERERIQSIIESLLFISGEPLGLERICSVLEGVEKKAVREALDGMLEDMMKQGRGIRVAEVAGGYQLETAKDNAEFVARLIKTKPIKLTKPALETMAIIAYRQPITKVEVDQIRGVDSGGVVKTLLEYNFLQIMGRKDVPGRPLIYGTSKKFLEFFRLKSLADLPSLEEFFSQAEQMETQDPTLFGARFQEKPGEGASENAGAEPEAAQPEPGETGGEPEPPSSTEPGGEEKKEE
jgi:segregation and condensation protein B